MGQNIKYPLSALEALEAVVGTKTVGVYNVRLVENVDSCEDVLFQAWKRLKVGWAKVEEQLRVDGIRKRAEIDRSIDVELESVLKVPEVKLIILDKASH